MKKKNRKIFAMAKGYMKEFEEDLKFILKAKNYRSLQDQFSKTYEKILNGIGMAFMAQAVVNESVMLRNRIKRILDSLKKDALKEQKKVAKKEDSPTNKIQYLDKNGNEIPRVPSEQMKEEAKRIQQPNLNRKQRRKLKKKRIKNG